MSSVTSPKFKDVSLDDDVKDQNEAVAFNLNAVQSTIDEFCQENDIKQKVTLVAVSKTKPNNMLEACYQEGQRHFGENYVQELVAKSKELPDDIKWHYIGPLQSNKAKLVASVPNLHVVETLHSQKLANKLNNALESLERTEPLNVFVQVNTSGEESKSGVTPDNIMELTSHIVENCSNLNLSGLMCIGNPEAEENEDFHILSDCRKTVCSELDLNPDSLELSMGMSSDYLDAIKCGATNVRVGSTIFGRRNYNK